MKTILLIVLTLIANIVSAQVAETKLVDYCVLWTSNLTPINLVVNQIEKWGAVKIEGENRYLIEVDGEFRYFDFEKKKNTDKVWNISLMYNAIEHISQRELNQILRRNFENQDGWEVKESEGRVVVSRKVDKSLMFLSAKEEKNHFRTEIFFFNWNEL